MKKIVFILVAIVLSLSSCIIVPEGPYYHGGYNHGYGHHGYGGPYRNGYGHRPYGNYGHRYGPNGYYGNPNAGWNVNGTNLTRYPPGTQLTRTPGWGGGGCGPYYRR